MAIPTLPITSYTQPSSCVRTHAHIHTEEEEEEEEEEKKKRRRRNGAGGCAFLQNGPTDLDRNRIKILGRMLA
jgi:hypothetical protein